MESRYGDLLSDIDLDVLGRASGHRPGADAAAWFRSDSLRIDEALREPATHDSLFGPSDDQQLDAVTPILVFAVVVHRGAVEIGEHSHIPERFGSRLVVPVFDGERLARFVDDRHTLHFLVELLGSYTRVLSGPHWYRSRGRWRRRRFSELNPAQLAQLAADMPLEERAGVYRRLGDLALFLNGVFPDHSARQVLTPLELSRIVRSVPDGRAVLDRLATETVDATGPVLAALGPTWYRLAARLVPIVPAKEQLVRAADHFDQARRFLNFVTDRYLWQRRDRLFPMSEA